MKPRFIRLAGILLALSMLASLCVFAAPVSAAGPKFSAWSAPVSLGSIVNSTAYDACPTISKDGLSLYFRSNRAGGYGGYDVYVTQRDSLKDAWEAPVNLGATINSSGNDYCTDFSTDGHWMLFVSSRPGGYGLQDIYLSHRKDNRDDFAWETPINIGPDVNTTGLENGPSLFEDEATGKIWLYYTHGASSSTYDIYANELISLKDLNFGPAEPVEELNTIYVDYQPMVRKDGLEVFFSSSRPGGSGQNDLWVSTRESTSDPWGTPVNLGAAINSSVYDFHPTLSWDGMTLIFASGPAESISGANADLYMCTRTKLTGRKMS